MTPGTDVFIEVAPARWVKATVDRISPDSEWVICLDARNVERWMRPAQVRKEQPA